MSDRTWAEQVADERPENCEPMSNDSWNALLDWIGRTYKHAKTVWRGHTSYGEKHQFERDTGIYVSNAQFKSAMRYSGHEAVNENEINWEYKIRLREKRDYQRPSHYARH